jgi:hypothetical protein
MSDLNLENIVGFKAVDKNGNERQVTVDEMTELVSARIVSAASEISTFAAAAAAGTDEFEDQLPQSDTFSWLRTLDGSKNPTLTSSSAAAKVLGGLIGTATASKNGLVPYYAGGVLSFQYGVKVSLGSIYRPFTCTISTYENAANTFIIAHINITGGSCAKALSRVGTVKIKYSASTKNIYIYNTTGDPIALQRLLNSVGREVTGFSQISSEPTESDLVDIPINAL